jgi:hypothetical protein
VLVRILLFTGLLIGVFGGFWLGRVSLEWNLEHQASAECLRAAKELATVDPSYAKIDRTNHATERNYASGEAQFEYRFSRLNSDTTLVCKGRLNTPTIDAILVDGIPKPIPPSAIRGN